MADLKLIIKGLILLFWVAQCIGLPQCIIMDPSDRSSFDVWGPCDKETKIFTVREYSDIEVKFPPYDRVRSQFLLMTSGPGSYCMETGLAKFGEDSLSEFTYRIDNVPFNFGVLSFGFWDDNDQLMLMYDLNREPGWATFSNFAWGWWWTDVNLKVKLKCLHKFHLLKQSFSRRSA